MLAVVVKAGIFADDDNKIWRREFTRNHTVLGMISLPEDLFYPTAAPTSILLAKAHIPHPNNEQVFMSRIWNDGFEKLKGKRVEIDGSQLPDTVDCFKSFLVGEAIVSDNCTIIPSSNILDGNEWSPQQWLPQPIETEEALKKYEDNVRLSLYRAVAAIPDLSEVVLDSFTSDWNEFEDYECGLTANVNIFFDVKNGKSTGEKNYREGDVPYISSGDLTNSIIRLV
ncbi:MAG: N-6 DNA methylase, partial [Pirellulaceae bacterium]